MSLKPIIMKKVVITICTCILVSLGFSEVFKPGMSLQDKYKKQPELDKFVGQWEFSSQGKYFKIILHKEKKGAKINNQSTGYTDFIVGRHVLKTGSVINQNSEGKSITTINVGVIEEKAPGKNVLNFRFWDLSNNLRGVGTMELRDKNTLIWKLRVAEKAMVIIDGKKPDTTFAVPPSAILTRKK